MVPFSIAPSISWGVHNSSNERVRKELFNENYLYKLIFDLMF
jgi:hypothetical protein